MALTVGLVGWGAFLGIVGQGPRIVVGLKKLKGEEGKAFSWFRLGLSIVISVIVGATAGIMYAVFFPDNPLEGNGISREVAAGIMTAGYAGTDFIEGLMPEELRDR